MTTPIFILFEERTRIAYGSYLLWLLPGAIYLMQPIYVGLLEMTSLDDVHSLVFINTDNVFGSVRLSCCAGHPITTLPGSVPWWRQLPESTGHPLGAMQLAR